MPSPLSPSPPSALCLAADFAAPRVRPCEAMPAACARSNARVAREPLGTARVHSMSCSSISTNVSRSTSLTNVARKLCTQPDAGFRCQGAAIWRGRGLGRGRGRGREGERYGVCRWPTAAICMLGHLAAWVCSVPFLERLQRYVDVRGLACGCTVVLRDVVVTLGACKIDEGEQPAVVRSQPADGVRAARLGVALSRGH